MPTELLVIGAGGHAKVVIEASQVVNPACHIFLADQDILKKGEMLLGNIPIRILGNWGALPEQYHVAIGDNQVRQQVSIVAQEQGKQLFTIVHPDAYVSPSASLESGVFVAAKAVIAAEAKIGEGCIINHGTIIDHDCCLGSYSHIAPNSTLSGGVKVGQGCLVGAGATLLPMVKVGDHAIIGAGAVVTCDVPDNQVVVGVPGRCHSSNE